MNRQTKAEARKICNDILKLHKQIQEIDKKIEIKNKKENKNEKKKL